MTNGRGITSRRFMLYNKGMSKYFEKAGAIILRDNNGAKEVLLEYRGRENLRDWSFPKGGVEDGESHQEAAARECLEETGLEIEIVKELPEIYYSNEHDGDVRVKMYLAEVKAGELRPEFEGDELKWVPCSELMDILSYEDLKDFWRKIERELVVEKLA